MSNLNETLSEFLKTKNVGVEYSELQRCPIYYLGRDRYMSLDNDGVFTEYATSTIRSWIEKTCPLVLAKEELKRWISEAFIYIQHKQVADFAGITAGYQVGYHVVGREKYRVLVTRTNHPVQPASGEWKLILSMMTQMFGPPDSPQFQTLCSWLKVFYSDMIELLYSDKNAPWRNGQAVALVGPPGAGKTLFGLVLASLFGTSVGRPMDYATGRTQFNEELFESAILWIDDESTRDRKERQEVAARMKQFVAASDMRRHAKFMKPVSMPPRNRLLWCVNNNPDALGALPKMEDGVSDKIMLFLVNKASFSMDLGESEGRAEFWRQIDVELPAFGHYLMNEFEIPNELHCGRFGVKTFHHPDILESLENLEYENRFLELIDVCSEEGKLEETVTMKKPDGSIKKAWVGRALALQAEVSTVIGHHEARMLFPHGTSCGRLLGKLSELFPDRVMRGNKTNGNVKWFIWPPESDIPDKAAKPTNDIYRTSGIPPKRRG